MHTYLKTLQAICYYAVLFIILSVLSGCGTSKPVLDNTSDAQNQSNTETESVAVAKWQQGRDSLKALRCMAEDTLYYAEMEWEENTGNLLHSAIYKKEVTTSQPQLLIDLGKQQPAAILPSKEGLFCILLSESEDDYIIAEYSQTGEQLFYNFLKNNILKEAKGSTNDSFEELAAAELDCDGNLWLADKSGCLLKLSSNGTVLGIGNALWTEASYHSFDCGLVNPGEDGVFLYRTDDAKIALQNTESALSSASFQTILDLSTLLSKDHGSLSLFNGYQQGILLNDSLSLWRYLPSTGQTEKLFDWKEDRVNLNGYEIAAIGVLEDNSFYISAYQNAENVYYIHISYQAPDLLPDTQYVTLSLFNRSYDAYENQLLEAAAAEFNKKHTAYQIQCITYDTPETLLLSLVKGEGPDLLDLNRLNPNILFSKNILEDLTYYFSQSSVISLEELLPCIQEAGTYENQFVCVIPSFGIQGFLVSPEAVSQKQPASISLESYLQLAKDHPESLLTDNGAKDLYFTDILQNTMKANMNHYIDWGKKECHFDTEEFIDLLEQISALPNPGWSISDLTKSVNMESTANYSITAEDLFYESKWLTYPFVLYSLENYQRIDRLLNQYGVFCGYPTTDDSAFYQLNTRSTTPLGINAHSQNKEGAWAFLEFLLSKEQQEQQEFFPVRKDAFMTYLSMEVSVNRVPIKLSENQRSEIASMTDAMYWTEASLTSDFIYMLAQEVGGVWIGEKSASDAANILQNRIQLYLNELE